MRTHRKEDVWGALLSFQERKKHAKRISAQKTSAKEDRKTTIPVWGEPRRRREGIRTYKKEKRAQETSRIGFRRIERIGIGFWCGVRKKECKVSPGEGTEPKGAISSGTFPHKGKTRFRGKASTCIARREGEEIILEMGRKRTIKKTNSKTESNHLMNSPEEYGRAPAVGTGKEKLQMEKHTREELLRK